MARKKADPPIKWNKSPKIVLLTGKEGFFKEHEIERAIAHFPDFIVEQYDGGEHDKAIRNSLTTAGFFSQNSVVVIRDVNKMKKHGWLSAYCDKPRSDRVVILCTANGGRLPGWVGKLKVSQKRECAPLPDWEIADWVVEESSSRGLSLRKAFAEAIFMNVGPDLYALSNELDKLSIYCKESKVVEQSDIEAVLFQHASFSPFDIVGIWGQGNQDLAIRYLIKHFESTPKTSWAGSELVLVKLFLDRVEKLLMAQDFQASGMPQGEIAKNLGISFWIYKNKVAPQVSARETRELIRAYVDLCRIEASIKIGKPGYLLLQSFILQH